MAKKVKLVDELDNEVELDGYATKKDIEEIPAQNVIYTFGSKDATGTFKSASESNKSVFVELGFRPTYVKVILPFSNGDTTAIYDESVSTTTSTWTIPMEGRTYTITLSDDVNVDAETGIIKIEDNGFWFHSHAANTLNVECTYQAKVSGKEQVNVKQKMAELDENKVDKEEGKGLFSGSYEDLTDKPTIPEATRIIDDKFETYYDFYKWARDFWKEIKPNTVVNCIVSGIVFTSDVFKAQTYTFVFSKDDSSKGTILGTTHGNNVVDIVCASVGSMISDFVKVPTDFQVKQNEYSFNDDNMNVRSTLYESGNVCILQGVVTAYGTGMFETFTLPFNTAGADRIVLSTQFNIYAMLLNNGQFVVEVYGNDEGEVEPEGNEFSVVFFKK